MYAIIQSGSRQYQVRPDSIIAVNRLPLAAGAAFETEQVLLFEGEGADTQIGTPYVNGARVRGTVISHYRGEKVRIYKLKRRKNYRRTRGHRQELTRLHIEAIEVGGKVVGSANPLPAPKPKRPAQQAERHAAAGAPAKPKAETRAAKPKAAAKPAKPKAAAKPKTAPKAAKPKAAAKPKPTAKAAKPKAAAKAAKPKASGKSGDKGKKK